MATDKLGLPKITSNMTADVVRDMNALADAIDGKVGVAGGIAGLDSEGNIASEQLGSVSKDSVGLGNVQNYGVATQEDAEAGTATDKYMTPAMTKKAILGLQSVKSVNSKTGAVELTASDVGAEPTLPTDRKRKITFGTAEPTGGEDGDIYFQYE